MSRPSPGQAARLTANSGRPPMAYTSDSALAAAIAPQSPGSSTIGVKKSVVRIRARSSSRRSTAASSASAAPMSRSPWAEAAGGIDANMASSLASGSLQAQPAPGDREVRRGVTPLRYARGAGYHTAVTVFADQGIGVYTCPRRMPAVLPLRTPVTTSTLPVALVYITCSYQ